MNSHKNSPCERILIIDDNTAIHRDFCKILIKAHTSNNALNDMEAALFGSEPQTLNSGTFAIDCASQGREGLSLVRKAQSEGHPYALAFVDGRMPPGWDGIETIRRLWQESPDLQVVLCTAYADYSWQEIRQVLGETDSLLILKKPFDNVEVLQLTHALIRKWELNRQIQCQIDYLGDTVRKETQEKEQIGAMLEASLAHSPAGIIIADAKDAKIRWSNPAALHILSSAHPFFPEGQSVNTDDHWQVFRTDGVLYAPGEFPLVRATVNGETIQNEEFIIRNARGHEKWISSNAAPVRDPKGIISAGILVVQDITERIQAQKERELLQSQLLQAHKMESLGVLAGGVAHDFNNLLHLIGGNIELLLMKKPANHRDVTLLKTVVKAIDRAAQLVRQLLQFSRNAEVKKQRVDVNHEVTETVKMLERIISKTVSIKLNMDPSVWPIHADPTQVEQIVLNLGGNAVDAMPHGGRLEISIRNVLVADGTDRNHLEIIPGPYVLMTLSDTGSGMDNETLKNAFDPFFTTKEIGKGTGLGLASVYGIVKGHNGFIHCSSKPGHGTTFKIYWPAMPERDTDKTVFSQATPQGGSNTILIVDDDSGIREMTAKMLRSFGYTTLTAANGEEALAIYSDKGNSIDLILLDVNMPGMDGYQCMQELLSQNPKVRILIASGYSALVQTKEVMQAGATGFIGKPYKLLELKTAVRSALDGQTVNSPRHQKE
ncbi:sensory box histidine kinase/response regulator [Desulforapulum autotrophicum HRM2]|uniref:histidine kinase n=1 Tax=Desulforapulum autotrophicum (strain ATCC 43914 / DSM 3382 / VKM B-1955 / HRM2) TaxID=177437 RepID=C0QA94_DESAH|nr:response regulator [Desulforapulum autotrophicum]ACN14679.1 sensory box histidine kinase/response regulator [Desulforapulum autotrophicum HRM2]